MGFLSKSIVLQLIWFDSTTQKSSCCRWVFLLLCYLVYPSEQPLEENVAVTVEQRVSPIQEAQENFEEPEDGLDAGLIIPISRASKHLKLTTLDFSSSPEKVMHEPFHTTLRDEMNDQTLLLNDLNVTAL